MIEQNPCRIDPAIVAALYVEHGDELRAFLYGVLRDGHLVNDVLQLAFVKALERGHTAHEESIKGWLFQVAFREALVVRRRQAVHDRASERIATQGSRQPETPDAIAIRHEDQWGVRQAVESLPASQQQIVFLRMHEGLKFAEIAKRLGLPLGTVIARMHAAIKRLKEKLER